MNEFNVCSLWATRSIVDRRSIERGGKGRKNTIISKGRMMRPMFTTSVSHQTKWILRVKRLLSTSSANTESIGKSESGQLLYTDRLASISVSSGFLVPTLNELDGSERKTRKKTKVVITHRGAVIAANSIVIGDICPHRWLASYSIHLNCLGPPPPLPNLNR